MAAVEAVEVAGSNDPTDEVAAFARAFNPLCRTWFWCVITGGVMIERSPSLGWMLLLVVLSWLVRLLVSTPPAVAWYLGGCIVLAAAVAVVTLMGVFPEPHDDVSSGPNWLTWPLLSVGLILFCRAMQPWLLVYDKRRELLARWRRSEIWAWFGLAVSGLISAWLLATEHSVHAFIDAEQVPSWLLVPLIGVMALAILGPLLSVGGSAAATKDSLEAYLASLDQPVTQ